MSDIIVSVIIPLYYGKKYIRAKISMILKAFSYAGIENKAEIIFVNDSPEQDISDIMTKDNIRIIVNKKNMGIQFSRIQGLIESKGRYIHFLDQDDKIKSKFYSEQLNVINNSKADVVIANGIYEKTDYKKVIYKNFIERLNVLYAPSYLILDNRILSPGQCLIRKAAIPNEWYENILKINGADDLFLWILMFEYHNKFVFNNKVLYLHKDTGVNLTKDSGNMTYSMNCFAEAYNKAIHHGKYRKLINAKIDFLNGNKNTVGYKFLSGLYKLRIIILGIREKNIYE